MPVRRSGSPLSASHTARSCVECRRLKRKCNKQDPCNICTRLNKTCTYAEEDSSRRLVEELSHQVQVLQQQLSQAVRAPQAIQPLTLSVGPHPLPEDSLSPHEPYSSTLLDLAHASQASGPFTFPPLLPSSADHERPPVRAEGYEWSEGQSTMIRRRDGTASLTEVPDGSGYLGFASGSTLLRVLQTCAGRISAFPDSSSTDTSPASIGMAKFSLSSADTRRYIDAYFHTFHLMYPFIHEATFRAQWNELIPRPPAPQWELLFIVLVAMGAFCTPGSLDVADHLLARAAVTISTYHFETGSLVLVQAFGLLANLAQKRGQPNTGFMYIGTATRMAISLGMHRELPLWHISPFEKEVRRRVWWWLYLADSGASMTFGRPILLPTSGADAKMIHNVDDEALTPNAACVPHQVERDTLYTPLIRLVVLQQVIAPIYTRIVATPPPCYAEVMSMDRNFDYWLDRLPSLHSVANGGFNFATYIVQWRQWGLRLIMHRRAFLERAVKNLPLELDGVSGAGASDDNDIPPDLLCSHKCLEAARKTIDSIQIFFLAETPNPSEAWYSSHYLFQAVFVILIALHTDRTSTHASEWMTSVETTRETLESMRHDSSVQKCLSIINDLVPRSSPVNFDDALFEEIVRNNPDWLFDLSMMESTPDKAIEETETTADVQMFDKDEPIHTGWQPADGWNLFGTCLDMGVIDKEGARRHEASLAALIGTL